MNKKLVNLLVLLVIFGTNQTLAQSQQQSPAILAAEKAFPVCAGSEMSSWNNCFAESVNIGKNIYTGEFQNGLPSGFGLIRLSNGDRYIGEFKNGGYDGKGAYVVKDGSKHIGNFRNDTREGVGIEYFSNGTVESMGIWRQGRFQNQIKIDLSVYPYTQDASFDYFMDIYKSSIDASKRKFVGERQNLASSRKQKEKYCFGKTSTFEPKSCDIKEIRSSGYYGSIMISEFIGKNQIKITNYLNERTKAMYPGTLKDVEVLESFERKGNNFTKGSGQGCFISGEIIEKNNEIIINEKSMSGAGCTDAQKRLFELYKGSASTYQKIFY